MTSPALFLARIRIRRRLRGYIGVAVLLGLTAPAQVVDLPQVPLNVPLPVPDTTPLPSAHASSTATTHAATTASHTASTATNHAAANSPATTASTATSASTR